MHHALHGKKLKSCVATQKPLISEENRQKRLDWAHAHKNWTVRHFKRVLWSDKTMCRLFRGFRGLVWRESHEKWDLDCLSGTVDRSKGHMYWGCFSWYGLGPIVALKSSVTGDSYVKILCGYVLSGLKKFSSSNNRGRTRTHTENIAKAFMAKNRIR